MNPQKCFPTSTYAECYLNRSRHSHSAQGPGHGVSMHAARVHGEGGPGAHLQAARDAEAAEVGAPLVHLALERHVVRICVLEELQHLQGTMWAHVNLARIQVPRKGVGIAAALPQGSASDQTS